MTTASGSEGRRSGLLTASSRAWAGIGLIVSAAAVAMAVAAFWRTLRRDVDDSDSIDIANEVCALVGVEGIIVNALDA